MPPEERLEREWGVLGTVERFGREKPLHFGPIRDESTTDPPPHRPAAPGGERRDCWTGDAGSRAV